MLRLGLIGVGNVGRQFARLLREAGYPLTVMDTDPSKLESALALGAQPADTPGEVADASDIILLSLPGSPAVEAVMEGPQGILHHLREGQLVVDTGTSRPETDIHYEQACRQKGAGFLDAPITGRAKGWIIMVGGAAEDFEQARPVLTCLGYKVERIGPIGQGQVLKLMNQMIQAGQLAIQAETIAFAENAGLDPRLLRDYLEFPIPEGMLTGEFSGGGHLALHYKDIGYALEVAHETGAHIPLTSLIHEVFKAVKLAGEPHWLQIAIVTYWRRLSSRPGERG